MYIHQGELLCDDCGEARIERLTVHWEKENKESYKDNGDSEGLPQYCANNSEADCPNHCSNGPYCLNAITITARDGTSIQVGQLLTEENLTTEGEKYVQQAIVRDLQEIHCISDCVQLWMDTWYVPRPKEYTITTPPGNPLLPDNKPLIKVTEGIDLLSWQELSDAEQKDLDYIESPDERGLNFFSYQGAIYDLCDIMRLETPEHYAPGVMRTLSELGFEGFNPDSFFSGIAVRVDRDEDRVAVALVLC